MKHLKSILVAALVLLVTGVTNAQDKNNPWAIEVGVNAVEHSQQVLETDKQKKTL